MSIFSLVTHAPKYLKHKRPPNIFPFCTLTLSLKLFQFCDDPQKYIHKFCIPQKIFIFLTPPPPQSIEIQNFEPKNDPSLCIYENREPPPPHTHTHTHLGNWLMSWGLRERLNKFTVFGEQRQNTFRELRTFLMDFGRSVHYFKGESGRGGKSSQFNVLFKTP